MVKISVVIPTRGRLTLLSKCLEAISPVHQTIERSMYEVIVSDDAGAKEIVDLIDYSYPWVKLCKGPGKGPAANRNCGAAMAQGEWLVFTDDDCIPQPNLLDTYLQQINKHPELKVLEGAVIPDDWELLKRDMAECPVNDKGGCFWSANIAIRRDLFFEIGGFDERFLIAAQEDQDLYIRIKELTGVPFIKEAIVLHPVRFDTLKNKYRKLESRYANWIIYYRKHHRKSLSLALLQSSWVYTKTAGKELLKGRPKSWVNQLMNGIYCIYLVTLKWNK